MKKLYLILALTFGLVYFSNAQDQQITLGLSDDYSVTAVTGYTYSWAVDAAGTDTDVSAVTGNSINVHWNQVAGTYNITVFATETATSCISATETISVQVLGQASVLFAAADADQTCSDLIGNISGGGGSAGNSSFEVQFSGGLAPYELKYKVLNPLDAQVGAEVTVRTGISCLRKGGAMTIIGNISPNINFPLQELVTRELKIQGSCASSGEYPACLEFLERGLIDVSDAISAVESMELGQEMFDRLYSKEPGLNKIILTPGK